MDNNNQPKRNRRKSEPVTETPNVEVTTPNKYAPKPKIGAPVLGRPANFVETVGLGKLQVIHATSSNDNSNVQSE